MLGVVTLGGAHLVTSQPPREPQPAPTHTARASVQPSHPLNLSSGSVALDSVGRPEQTGQATNDSARAARRDSIAAADSTGLRIIVSLTSRELWVLMGTDTLHSASVGVGMDSTLEYKGRTWNFHTPRGLRRVLGKTADPTWAPPEWHYVEEAKARGLKLARLPATRPLKLDDGSEIVTQDGEVGLVRPSEPFTPFAIGEEIIWDGTLYVPPLGTKQRQVVGELGRFRLDLGDGYLLHGTPYQESIGQPSSHGCIRLADGDIEWLYNNVPVGTRVIIR